MNKRLFWWPLLCLFHSIFVKSWNPNAACSYTFTVWQPSDDIVNQVKFLEYKFGNITSYVEAKVMEMKATFYYEMNKMCPKSSSSRYPRGHRRSGSKIRERDLPNSLSAFQREYNVMVKRLNDLGNDYVELRNKIPTTPVATTPFATTQMSALVMEDQSNVNNKAISKLENGVNDLKAEWIVMKRQLMRLTTESSHLKNAQNSIRNSSLAVENMVKKLDGKLSNILETFKGTQADNGDQFSKSLTDIGGLKDKQEELEVRMHGVDNKVDDISSSLRTLNSNFNLIKDDNAQQKTILLKISKATQRSGTVSDANSSKFIPSPKGIPTDCEDIYRTGVDVSSLYQIKPEGAVVQDDVYCQFVNNSAYTVIQRRTDGLLNFNRRWIEYKFGFGNLYAEFWLGNELIHLLTKQRRTTLRIDMWDWQGKKIFAEYDNFQISGSDSGFKMTFGEFRGNAGDSLSYHNGMKFSTEDEDNDLDTVNCAAQHKSGWWFNKCFFSNLNGVYHIGWYSAEQSSASDGIVWYTLKGKENYSLRKVEMKLRRMP